MSNNWVNVKSSNKAKNIKEEEYLLSDILLNSGCIRCMNKSCSINEDHGIPFPDKMSVFVQNPTYINGMEQAIKNARLDFNGKKPFYTICNYTNKKCRNCEEGRIKYVDFNKEKIALCYPPLEAIKYKVTVGLHIDIKLILKGTKFDVSAIPLCVLIQDKTTEKSEFIKEEEKQKELSSQNSWPELSSNINLVQTKVDKPVLSFSKIQKSLSEEKIIVPEKPIITETVVKINTGRINHNKLKTSKLEDKTINTDVEVQNIKETKIVNADETSLYKKEDKSLKHEPLKINVDDSLLIEKENKIKSLLREIKLLKDEMTKLYCKNKMLEEKNQKEMFIIKNQHKYDEILDNVKNLNTRITQQFFETNYQEYVLI
jgi:hypothetical protein